MNLTCTRRSSDYEATLFWIRLVSGKRPAFLGGTFAFDYDGVKKHSHITAKQEPGSFVLHINEAELKDTGVYYCIKVDQLDVIFLKETFLRVKGNKLFKNISHTLFKIVVYIQVCVKLVIFINCNHI